MLEVKNIHAWRGPAHILHGVSLSVRSHEVVCLVGRNGAGKTTTMESIMGFVPVKSGQILFHGEEVTSLPVHSRARRGMGYAPEGCEIFPELTVAENMMISRWMSAKARRRLEALADGDVEERVFSVFPEVRELMRRQGMNLSGGQRKMVAIARGMALAPTLLLLDEAFEGLAPVVAIRSPGSPPGAAPTRMPSPIWSHPGGASSPSACRGAPRLAPIHWRMAAGCSTRTAP